MLPLSRAHGPPVRGTRKPAGIRRPHGAWRDTHHLLGDIAPRGSGELCLQLHEVDAGGLESRPHEGLNHVQEVQRGAEHASEFPPVVECRCRRIAEISCDEDVCDFDHISKHLHSLLGTRRARRIKCDIAWAFRRKVVDFPQARGISHSPNIVPGGPRIPSAVFAKCARHELCVHCRRG